MISKESLSSSPAKNSLMNDGPTRPSLAWKLSKPSKNRPPSQPPLLRPRMAPNNLIDGRAIAEQIHSETAQRIEQLKKRGLQPGLAFVRVGEDPASKVYVGMKEKTSAQLGIHSETRVLPEATTEADLLVLLAQLNAEARIHGILVQAPLPKHIREAVVYATVAPEKDVDGFHPVNVG